MRNLSDFLNKDVFDSRDVLERIEQLKDEGRALKDEIRQALMIRDISELTQLRYQAKELENEIALLQDFREECENYTNEFRYGETIISWRYFEEYCQDFATDCGYLPNLGRNILNPIHNFINWKEWADFMLMDYAEVSCNGGNYFIRRS